MGKKTFYKWMRSQKNRNDPIGDLAEDIIMDKQFPKYVKTSYKKIEIYLNLKNADDNIINTLKKAWNEYIDI